jgi:hypothetical protein
METTMLFKRPEKHRKIFCIGRNKTGTTSMFDALQTLGYRMGDQLTAERLLFEYEKRDFRKLIKYCQGADAFQDIPFSFPYTFIAMDQAFPDSRFILTIRDSPEQWYDSMIRFQSKVHAGRDSLPSAEELKATTRIFPGFAYHTKKIVYNTPDDDLYNRAALIHSYTVHNETVQDYFRTTPEKLLVLNVAEPDAYERLCHFLGRNPSGSGFSWLNKT